MNSAASDFDALAECVADTMPSGERWEKSRMSVEDSSVERVEERGVKHGSESGHGDHVNVSLLKCCDNVARELASVEVGTEIGSLNDKRGNAPGVREVDDTASSVDYYRGDIDVRWAILHAASASKKFK